VHPLQRNPQQILGHRNRPVERFSCLRLDVIALRNRIKMREHEPAKAGFTGHLAALAGVQVDRVRPVRGERTVEHGEIGVPAEPHERSAVLRIS
jgi:hypothetical protein